MKKEITFAPAFDKRHTDPKQNYGIHGVDLRFLLIGELGAVQFVVYTGWMLPNVRREYKLKGFHSDVLPADVGYHSLTPQYEGQDIMSAECPYLNNKPCYYDGSGLQANTAFDILTEKGSDGVWEYLEQFYISIFKELK